MTKYCLHLCFLHLDNTTRCPVFESWGRESCGSSNGSRERGREEVYHTNQEQQQIHHCPRCMHSSCPGMARKTSQLIMDLYQQQRYQEQRSPFIPLCPNQLSIKQVKAIGSHGQITPQWHITLFRANKDIHVSSPHFKTLRPLVVDRKPYCKPFCHVSSVIVETTQILTNWFDMHTETQTYRQISTKTLQTADLAGESLKE